MIASRWLPGDDDGCGSVGDGIAGLLVATGPCAGVALALVIIEEIVGRGTLVMTRLWDMCFEEGESNRATAAAIAMKMRKAAKFLRGRRRRFRAGIPEWRFAVAADGYSFRMKDAFGVFAFALNRAVSAPVATVIAFILVCAWLLSGSQMRYDSTWQLVMNTTSSVITFLMVFILNYAQNRDTNAINTKLDALILAVERADNRVVGLERLPHTEAEAMQQEMRSLKAIADEVQSIAEEHEGG